MEKFDREMQLLILKAAAQAYPSTTNSSQFLNQGFFTNQEKAMANTCYLMEHGLIRCVSNERFSFDDMADCLIATKDGIDFLLADGGLGAILNVQTIRLHNDTVIAIEDLIALSSIPEHEKASIVSKLRELPADTIKHLTLQLLTQGALHLPVAIQLIQKYLQKG